MVVEKLRYYAVESVLAARQVATRGQRIFLIGSALIAAEAMLKTKGISLLDSVATVLDQSIISSAHAASIEAQALEWAPKIALDPTSTRCTDLAVQTDILADNVVTWLDYVQSFGGEDLPVRGPSLAKAQSYYEAYRDELGKLRFEMRDFGCLTRQ
jgi:hypothetical protein